ncbi:MAG TPA: M24 family metallopeptidase [Stellaceae bacterium]|nr:M24 family metallopeptidase [Stellaceae bacterium]
MRSVHPAIIIGSYGWDADRLPRDEFQLRISELNRLMDERGWKAMLIHGDARDHGLLAYFTNFIPRLRWAMALVPRHGEPRLLISMSSRDMPAMKPMTWIADVRTGWDWAGGFDQWLAGLADEGDVGLGTIGFDVISADLFRAVERSLGNRFHLDDATPLLPRERRLRPRELSLTRDAALAVEGAAAAILRTWRAGGGNEAAALAGEREARAKAAQDVRTLTSLDRGLSVSPFQGRLAERVDPLLAYVAVQDSGFWGELFVSASVRPNPLRERAEAGLAAALAAMVPGALARDIFARATGAMAPYPLHPVLSASIGRRIGVSLDEGGVLQSASDARLEPGSVYALHVGGIDPAQGGAIVSAMVALTPRGAEILCRSPSDQSG